MEKEKKLHFAPRGSNRDRNTKFILYISSSSTSSLQMSSSTCSTFEPYLHTVKEAISHSA